MIEAVARELRRPVRLGDAVVGEVMRRVQLEGRAARGRRPGNALSRVVSWAVRPRTVRVSPLGALAALAASLLLAVGLARRSEPAVGVVQAPAGAREVPASLVADRSSLPLTQFILVAPAAREVSLVGDFNDWQVGSARLRATASGGVWTIEVPLAPGRHRYAFVVDGSRWLPDPAAPRAAGDDFGTPSSVVTVTEQGV
jgi:hypothetical protein